MNRRKSTAIFFAPNQETNNFGEIMKAQFASIFSNLSHCSHIPHQYYGHLITLSGMVYDEKTDKFIEDELKQLSMAYQGVHNLDKIKEIIHETVFWTKPEKNNRMPDIEHLIRQHQNANLDQINTLIVNLAQLYNHDNNEDDIRQQRTVVDFTPLIKQLEKLDLKPISNYEFNLPKIIGWITQKGIGLGFLNAPDEQTNDDPKALTPKNG
jgi:hypothetical protein